MDTQADAARGSSPSDTVRDASSATPVTPSNGTQAQASSGTPQASAAGGTPSGGSDGRRPAKRPQARPATEQPAAPQSKPDAPAKAAPASKPAKAAKVPRAPRPAPAAKPARAAKQAPAARAAASPPQRPAPPAFRLPAAGVATAADVVAEREPDTYEEEADLPDLLDVTERLREQVSALQLPLRVPDVPAARTDRERLLAQLDDYLLPRLRRMDAPLLAVIGGSTGAGKSTLTNSLVRKEVSRSGVLRPTTRSPVLVHHPYDSGAFLSQRILPNLARVTAEAPEPLQPIDVNAPRITALRLVPHEGVPAGIALIDAPDIDSVVETNRELAVQLLAAADLWLFVTTAARYADAMPWEMLRMAVDRGASVAVILDRVPPESLREVRLHLATMLRDRGLASSPMFTIPETQTVDGLLPQEAVASLVGWLRRLAKDARSREVIVRRTLAGALDSLRDRVHVVADAADVQRDADAALRDELDDTFARSAADLAARSSDGTVLRGEVLARWQEFVGTGELTRSLEANLGRLKDRLTASLRGRTAPSEPLAEALHTGAQAAVRATAQAAREQAVLRWRASPAGEALLAQGGSISTLAPDFDARLAKAVTQWQEHVLALVREESQGRRTTARSLSLGLDGTAVILQLAAFSRDADRSEADVAAGAADVAQQILRAVFGDAAAETMTTAALDDFVERAAELVESERARLVRLLDVAAVLPDAGDRLRAAALAIEEAR